MTLTVLAGLPLRGNPPKRVVLIGLRDRPFDTPVYVGTVLIIFGGPVKGAPPGFDGTYLDVRPFSALKMVKTLIRQADSAELPPRP